MSRFTKDYERRSQHDGQLQISVKAGTKATVEEVADGYFSVTTEKPCTKNGGDNFDLSEQEISDYLSDVDTK